MFFSLSSSSSSSSISPVFVCCCLPSSHSFYLCFSGSLCASYIYISPHDQRRNTAKNKRKEKEDDETKRRQNFKHFSDPKCQMPNTISMQLYIFGSLCFFFCFCLSFLCMLLPSSLVHDNIFFYLFALPRQWPYRLDWNAFFSNNIVSRLCAGDKSQDFGQYAHCACLPACLLHPIRFIFIYYRYIERQ